MNLDRARRLDGALQPFCRTLGALRRLSGAPPARPQTAADPLPEHAGDVAVVKLVGLGSLALLAPWLQACHGTGRAVHLITDAANAPLTKLFDDSIQVHLLRPEQGWRDAVRIVQELRPRRVAMLDLEFYSAATTLLATACRPAVLAGLDAPWRRGVLTHALSWPEGLHFADLARHALSQLCGRPLAADPALPLASDALAEPPPRQPDEQFRVVVNASCGPLCPERRLPPTLQAAMLTRLTREPGVRLHFIGTASDRAAVDEVMGQLPGAAAVEDHVGQLNLGELLALFRSADLVISSDSGPLHLAAGVGARTLSFYGPETPARFGPRGPQHTIVVGRVPCGPCLTAANQKQAPCHGRNMCLQQLDPRELADLAWQALTAEEQSSRTITFQQS